jgi:hypothetical protein
MQYVFQVIVGVGIGIVVYHDAQKRGMSPIVWAILCGIFPPMAILFLLLRDPVILSTEKTSVDPAELKECPMCLERIRWDARVCKFCHHEFSTDEIEHQKQERQRLLEEIDDNAIRTLSELKLLEIAYDYQYNKADLKRAKYYLDRLLKEYPQGEYIKDAKERLAVIMVENLTILPAGSADNNLVGFKTCPMCSEQIKSGARICRHCRHTFTGHDVE